MNEPETHEAITPEEAKLVRQSFLKLIPVSQEAAGAFYGRVFQLMPEARSLFSTDIQTQGEKFMMMLAVLIDAVNSPAKLHAECVSLGKSHNRYGVQPGMYPHVGEALIATLREFLGPVFNDETEQAWKRLYTSVSSTMIRSQEG